MGMNTTTQQPVRIDKVKAARKAIRTLSTAFDLDLWADSHPNEENALNRVLRDLEAMPDPSPVGR